MTDVSRLDNIIGTHLGVLATGAAPQPAVPLREKYFTRSPRALHGLDLLYRVRLAFAANWGILMAFGILPVILPEAIVQVRGPAALNVNISFPMLLDGAQKVLGIFITILMAIGFALFSVILEKVSTGIAVLIILQVFFSGIAVIYLDEVLKKGYGLLPSNSLLTATNICVSVLWSKG